MYGCDEWGSGMTAIAYAKDVGLNVWYLFQALRPQQWVKNGILLAGILFTLDQRHPLGAWLMVGLAVAVFCLLSSAIYLVNDLCDLERDRLHPRKRNRPLASGKVSPRVGVVTAAVLSVVSLRSAVVLDLQFGLVALTYFALTLAYSLHLKHQVILDVMSVAAGFLLRAVAGAVVIKVTISPWLVICTTLLALLLSLAKRRHELVALEDQAGSHRKILHEYTEGMLDQMITIITASTLMSYALYTFYSPTAKGRPMLMLTLPLVIYGLLRFLYLVHRRAPNGHNKVDVVEDRPLIVTALLWALLSAAIVALT